LANHSLTAWPVFAANCGRALKLYYVQAYEPDYYRLSKKPFKHLLARTSYLLNLQQIANSASYRGAGLRPVAIIPPGIDLSVFTVKKPDVNFEAKDRIVLGTIGRTEPYKGTATAISSYRSLRQTEPRLHMKIGFGNVAPADDLEIVPIKGDAQLAAFYRSVDVLVVACYGQHGAPHYPLIEAMASGTPVVHTGYYPGSPENSWQAYDSSVEGLTAALWDLFRTPVAERARRIAAARETVARTLSWDAVAQQLEESFEKLRDFG
jgi:glycosyltransferase involved in cell wall biosynthesis